MTTSDIIHEIDSEIEKLRRARTLLIDAAGSEASATLPGSPMRSTKQETLIEAVKAKKVKRSISAEGKARIAAAQRARWAAQKKAQKPAKQPRTVAVKKTVKVSAKRAAKTGKTTPVKSKKATKASGVSAPVASVAAAT